MGSEGLESGAWGRGRGLELEGLGSGGLESGALGSRGLESGGCSWHWGRGRGEVESGGWGRGVVVSLKLP